MARILVLFVIISSLAAQTKKEVEIGSEPSHKFGSFEWGDYRVYSVDLAPHAVTLLHRHRHDYVSITLEDSHIADESEGRPPVDLKLKEGEARFRKGGFAHIVKNLSDQQFHEVIVELLGPGKNRGSNLSQVKDGDERRFPGGKIKTLFTRDGVWVDEINLEPGATVPDHHYYGPHLVVAITDCDLRGDIDGWEPMPLQLKVGDTKALPGGYTNTGNKPARFVTLGF